jgi:hypothetical protein
MRSTDASVALKDARMRPTEASVALKDGLMRPTDALSRKADALPRGKIGPAHATTLPIAAKSARGGHPLLALGRYTSVRSPAGIRLDRPPPKIGSRRRFRNGVQPQGKERMPAPGA